MSEDERRNSKRINATNGFIKGNKCYHATQGHRYQIRYDTSTATAVNVMDTTARSANAVRRNIPARGDWVFRLDRPHRGAEFNHVNINNHISGVPDPHIQLPPGGLATGKGVAKVCQAVNKVNKVAVPVAIAIDVVQTGRAVYKDYENGTTRNTVKKVASSAGGWSGGYGGATAGAAVGTAIFPGVGTIIGGICGAIGGGILGSIGAESAVDMIGDELNYDITERKCKSCGDWFKIHTYEGETDRKYCDDCDSDSENDSDSD